MEKPYVDIVILNRHNFLKYIMKEKKQNLGGHGPNSGEKNETLSINEKKVTQISQWNIILIMFSIRLLGNEFISPTLQSYLGVTCNK